MAFPAIASALGSNSNAGIEGPMFIIQLIDQAIKRGQISSKLAPYRKALQTQEEQVGEIGRMRNQGLPQAYEANLRQLADAQGDAITRNLDSAAGVSPLNRSIANTAGTLQRSRELGDIGARRAMNQQQLTGDLFQAQNNRDTASKELMNAKLALEGQADAEVVSAIQGLGVGAQGVASALGGISKSKGLDTQVAGNAPPEGLSFGQGTLAPNANTQGYIGPQPMGDYFAGSGMNFGTQGTQSITGGLPGTSGIGGGAIGGGLMGQYGTAPGLNNLNGLPQGQYANASSGMASLGPTGDIKLNLSGPANDVQNVLGKMQFGGVNPQNEDLIAYGGAYGQRIGSAFGTPIGMPGNYSVGPPSPGWDEYMRLLQQQQAMEPAPSFAKGGIVPRADAYAGGITKGAPATPVKATVKGGKAAMPVKLHGGEGIFDAATTKELLAMKAEADAEPNSYRAARITEKMGGLVKERLGAYTKQPQIA